MDIIQQFVVFLALVWILFSFLPLIKLSYWWIRVLDYPRIQILILGTATMLAYLLLIHPLYEPDVILLIVLAIAMFYQGIMVFPFTVISKKQSIRNKTPDEKQSFSLLISNVRMKNRTTNKLIDLIKELDPDIVFTAETDHYWKEHLDVIEKDYPYTVKHPLENTYGMLMYSKLKLVESTVNFYIKEDIPSILTKVRLPSGDLIKLYAIHPEPPRPKQDTDERDAEILLAGKSIREKNEHAVIFGDLNDVGWSHTTSLFRKVSAMLDPRIGRGMYNTYNANIPFFRFPLDHIFHTDHFKLVELIRLSHIGSDHYPMYVKLEYTGHKNGQNPPEADAKELEEADERIEDGKEK